MFEPIRVVWLLPATYLAHILEEYFAGTGFAAWFSKHLDAHLSNTDFIIINAIAFSVVLTVAVLFSIGKKTGKMAVAIGTVFFVNGIIHIAASLLTMSYSPGTVTGALLYLPLGFLVHKFLFPALSASDRQWGIAIGMGLQVVVFLVAKVI